MQMPMQIAEGPTNSIMAIWDEYRAGFLANSLLC